MSRGAFLPPMVHAWCMHGPFSTPSQYSSAFEFPPSMIHHHTTVPCTHSGSCARRPTAYPHMQAHSQCVAVAPYHHAPTVASVPRCSRATAYAHPHLHHTQPTATLHHCRRRSPLACHHYCRPAPSTCRHRCHLRVSPSTLTRHGVIGIRHAVNSLYPRTVSSRLHGPKKGDRGSLAASHTISAL